MKGDVMQLTESVRITLGHYRETMIINPQEIGKDRKNWAVLWLIYIAWIFRMYFSPL
jgi:hypothetical protein